MGRFLKQEDLKSQWICLWPLGKDYVEERFCKGNLESVEMVGEFFYGT